MHQGKQLKEALDTVPTVHLAGVFYRSIPEAAIHSLSPPKPLYSLGPRKTGQRFTPKDGPASLYTSADFDISYFETHGTAASIRAHGLHFIPPPTVIIAISVDIQHVLDLTDATVMRALGTNQAELAEPWFEQMIAKEPVPTHILARAAHLSGRFQALRFMSAQRTGAINLMVWPKKLTAPSFIEVNDPSHRMHQRIP